VTLIVGKNSAGKTTVLDAMKVALWPYISGYDLGSTTSTVSSIQIADVRLEKEESGKMEYRLNSSIEVFGNFFGITKWERYRESIKKGTKTKEDNYSKKLKKKAAKHEENIFSDDPKIELLPIICYYGTGRLWSQKSLTKSSKKMDNEVYSKTFAYRDCLDPSSSFKHFAQWYIHIFKSYREAQIKNIENNRAIEDVNSNLVNPIKVIQKAVNSAIEKHTGWKDLAYSEEMEQEIVLSNDEKGMLKVNMMSDGVRNVVSLVADIAYRCYKLNPHLGLNAALATEGIVLVDEIDMHLHPQWQQSIVSDLKEAFPKVQFIMTTHSPQVLSTVDSSSIRIIDEDSVFSAPKGTEGAEASRILKRVLGVNPRPQENRITKMLSRYLESVYEDKWDDEDTKKLRVKLDETFGDEEPLLHEADLYIENKIWEQTLEKDS